MKTDTTRSPKDQDLETKALNRIAALPRISVDYDAFEHLLCDTDLSDHQKRQFLQAVWSVVYGFASLGFEVHPIQAAQESACGQVEDTSENRPKYCQSSVEFNMISNHENSTRSDGSEQTGDGSATL